jgi:hypothetical protein
MPELHVKPQSKPFTARQVARLISISLRVSEWLSGQEAEDAMAERPAPALMVTTPDGREFLITVEEIK